MRVYHNSRDRACRTPYGALELGKSVTLSLDVLDAPGIQCLCRVWVDGVGERWHPMTEQPLEHGSRFTCTLTPEEPALVWYSFLLRRDGEESRYGAKEGTVGGEGCLYPWEPPSFQITVYRPRSLPQWYRNSVVYQIFPDRFARGTDWRERAEQALSTPRNGPGRRLVDNWYTHPRYDKDEKGRIRNWDFYGGTLSGIREKLPQLRDLGISALYLNPIFEAASNHRYDTGDYTRIDPMLGTEEDFAALCEAAREHGIRIILDGVFNHTGCDSRYFNRYGNYPSQGAWQGQDSPYRNWFHIREDGSYDCWWGVDDLPDLNEAEPSYRDFICQGEDSVVRRWLRAGASGWRLDVADELPDDFVAAIKEAALAQSEEAVVLGEVWEDASHKVSYGKLRRYFLGEELDGVMNYPLRDGLLEFALGRISGPQLRELLESLRENYPPEALFGALNLLGSHDRPRLLTVLGEAPHEGELTEQQRWAHRLSPGQRDLAKKRLWLLTLCQMTLPGVPCVYYGDEAGLEGYADPCNRAAYPWGQEDEDTAAIYRGAISLRRTLELFVSGSLELPDLKEKDLFGFVRRQGEESAVVLINRSGHQCHTVRLPAPGSRAAELVAGQSVAIADGYFSLTLPPMGSAVVYFPGETALGAPMPDGLGVLCHITSLPGQYGPGTLGPEAKAFVEQLAQGGCRYWQILPVHPTDHYGSPYAGVSAFAGNPNLIDTGGRTLEECFRDFTPDESYDAFCRNNQDWLLPYATFMAIQTRMDRACWQDWPQRWSPELARRPELSDAIAFHQYCQYEFDRQWKALRQEANRKGILLLGDMPMYVSSQSADVWANPEQFQIDEAGRLTECAGVPPDYFSTEGQLWGNPLYCWEHMAQDGYCWWLKRMKRAFVLYDYVRMDHFRGFEAYWSVPAGKKAVDGRWRPGPGVRLFEAARAEFGPLPILAEDLGVITPGVRGLLARCGFPGMDVLQFYEGESYQPPAGKVVYTGTHDNQTLLGWCQTRYAADGLKTEASHLPPDSREMAARLMKEVLGCGAGVVILPLQDVLELGDEARMNTPGTVEHNWSWQVSQEQLDGLESRLQRLNDWKINPL